MSDTKEQVIKLEMSYSQAKAMWHVLKNKIEDNLRAVEAFNESKRGNNFMQFRTIEGQTLRGIMEEMLLQPAEEGLLLDMLGYLAKQIDDQYFNKGE